MPQCNHEEADTRIIIRVQDSLLRGTNTIMICTIDTDIIVLFIGHFYALLEQNPMLIFGWLLLQVSIFATTTSILSVQILVLKKVGDFHLFMHLLDVIQHPLSLAKVKCQLGWLGNPIWKLQELSFTLLSSHMSLSLFLPNISSFLRGSQWYYTTNPALFLQSMKLAGNCSARKGHP